MKKTLLLRANCFVRVKVKRSKRPCLRKRHVHHCKPHPQNRVCQRVCGIIFQPCDGNRQTYFTSLKPTGSAVVRVQNDASCEMKLVLETRCRDYVQPIAQGQQVSVAVPSLQRVLIECGDCESEGAPCRGQYEVQWL